MTVVLILFAALIGALLQPVIYWLRHPETHNESELY